MKWKRDGKIILGGDVGGDYQVSESWNQRYRAEEDPTRVIDVYFFAEAETEYASEVPAGPYKITRMTWPTICQDPKQPPGDTEVWSATRYDVVQKDIEISSDVEYHLGRMAYSRACEHTADLINWDGTTEGWKSS